MAHQATRPKNNEATAVKALSNSLLRKELLSPPKLFRKGEDPKQYVSSITTFCDTLDVSDQDRLFYFVNNMEEDMRFELFALREYSEKCNDFQWLTNQFIALNTREDDRASPLAKLLSLRQQGTSTREFISRLRVCAYRLMGDTDPEGRERKVITALTNGLDDRNIAVLIKSEKPRTVEDAIGILKLQGRYYTTQSASPNTETPENIFSMDSDRDAAIAKLQNDIQELRQQIRHLTAVPANSRQRPPTAQRRLRPDGQPTNAVSAHDNRCYNCGTAGHISRNCRRSCAICGRSGHTSYKCQQRLQQNQQHRRQSEIAQRGSFRLLQEEDLESIRSEVAPENLEGSIEVTSQGEDQVRILGDINRGELSYLEVAKKSLNKYGQIKTGVSKSELEWADYIEGHRNRPEQPLAKREPTVITNRRAEKAANKPIVHATCENVPSKIFLDSGAECNVISTYLLRKIHRVVPGLKFYPRQDKIRCANGNTMISRGIIWLNVGLGDKLSKHPFKVIQGIFPDLIGGIKLLKHAGVNILASDDCAKIGNERLPFLSKVEPEYQEVSKN